MKQFHLYIVSVTLLLLSACNSDNDELPGGGDNTLPAALHIKVSANDFANANGISTRATDNGSTTTFENGDCIGITVLGTDNKILSNNIPYKYNNGTWSFDSGNSEGKTAIFYDNKAATYLAYFPYSAEADDAKSEANLKAKFQPQYDQRSKAAYCASDLLVWSETASSGVTPSKTLAIAFTHAYASLSLSPSVKCKINGVETTFVPSGISDVSFTVGIEPFLPYQAADGSYRIVTVPQSSSVSARWFFTYSAKTYNGSMSVNALAEKSRYVLTPSLKDLGDYSLDKAKMGDFYCKSSDGSTGYLIPGEIAELTDDQKSACLGIVLKAGKDDSGEWKDNGSYTLKDGTTDMPTIHGYVLALKDGNGGSTCVWGSYYIYDITIGTDQSRNSLFCGYSNMQTIKTYLSTHSDKSLQNDFPAAYHASEGYESIESGKYSSPGNSSGWFLPSAGQCWYWSQYRVLLKESMEKAGGDEWQNYYWSSSEFNNGSAWCVGVSYGNVHRVLKYGGNANKVRSCLAF